MNISIIVATFGSPEWLARGEQAAVSAQGQGAIEIIVNHQTAGTLAEVRNEAAVAASGNWLVFVDGDDELAPGYLAALAEAWRDWTYTPGSGEGVPLLVPAVQYVHPDGYEEPSRIPQKGLWPKLNECVIGTAVSRDLFLAVGGFREWSSLEDYDLFLRCYDAGARLVYVPAAVYRARLHHGVSRNADQTSYPEIWAEHVARERAAGVTV